MQETAMKTVSMMLLVLISMMMARKTNKTPIFGQMTLRATKALEFLKTSDEAFKRNVKRILWIQKHEAEKDEWEMPDWVMASEKYNWCAILVDQDLSVIPLLVYQPSALQAIEAHLMTLESQGAEIDQVNPRRMEVGLGEGGVAISLWRNPKGGKFAKYHVTFDQES